MRVALIDNDTSSLDEAVKTLKAPDSEVLAIQADVSDFSSMQNAASKVQERFGKNINILALNAGTSANGANSWNAKMDVWTKVRRRITPASEHANMCLHDSPDTWCQPVRRHQWIERLY
jgi:NADP-dependent 3-hydroxy acid dehydrogenase YdfG